MSLRFKVLVVEDSPDIRSFFICALEDLTDDLTLLFADTIQQGHELFAAHPDLNLIVVDACVPGNQINTDGLVRKVKRAGYDGELVAMSSIDQYRQRLLEAGCTREIEQKLDVPEYIRMRCLTSSSS